jgi:uncharacterized membrane protein
MPRENTAGLSPKGRPKARKTTKIILSTYILTVSVFSFFGSGIILAPYLRSISSAWASLVYAVYAPFCHQIPERSMNCFDQSLAVCSRCLGIYLGVFLGLILYPIIRGSRQVRVPEPKVFFSFSVPLALDAAANVLRLWQSPNAVRLATGLLWGVLLPFYFIAGVVDFFEQRQKWRRGRNKNSA